MCLRVLVHAIFPFVNKEDDRRPCCIYLAFIFKFGNIGKNPMDTPAAVQIIPSTMLAPMEPLCTDPRVIPMIAPPVIPRIAPRLPIYTTDAPTKRHPDRK